MIVKQIVALIAELEHTNRSTFISLDKIVDLDTKEEKLECVTDCMKNLEVLSEGGDD